MKRVLVLVVLSLLGAGAGAGAGTFLRPAPVEPSAEGGGDAAAAEGATKTDEAGASGEAGASREDEVAAALEMADAAAKTDEEYTGSRDFVRLEKQFVVPVLGEERVASLVVLSIALEVEHGGADFVFAAEPKLRDRFLGVLFTHAQSQGFDGGFTRKDRLSDLRRALTLAAQDVLGELAYGVLLTNVLRQDI